jgi:hypothetical protein
MLAKLERVGGCRGVETEGASRLFDHLAPARGSCSGHSSWAAQCQAGSRRSDLKVVMSEPWAAHRHVARQ